MRHLYCALLITALAGAPLIALPAGAAEVQAALSVPLSTATQVPVQVSLTVGQPTMVQIPAGPAPIIGTAPPDVVHAILHGNTILLIPLREGEADLSIRLSGKRVATLALSVGNSPGVRLVTLTEAQPTTAAAPASPSVAPSRPTAAPVQTATTPADSASAFVAGLSDRQRLALVSYLQTPSPDSLAALVRVLNPDQQHALMGLLADPDALAHVTAHIPGSVTPTSAPAPITPAITPSQPSPVSQAVALPHPAPGDPPVTVRAPQGTTVYAIPTASQGAVYISYVIQNTGTATMQIDPHAITVTGARPVAVRQMDVGTPGQIVAGSMETGVIQVVPTGQRVKVTWPLGGAEDPSQPLSITVDLR